MRTLSRRLFRRLNINGVLLSVSLFAFTFFLVSFSNLTFLNSRKSSADDDNLQSQLALLRRRLAVHGIDSNTNNVLNKDTIYVITPTYARPQQKAELTRLCQTLLLVPDIHWIVVEDAHGKSDLVSRLLRNCGVPHTHLNEPTPDHLRIETHEPSWKRPKGVLQRNEAIYWLRNNAREGIVYFGDDDNTYDIRIFDEMRHTKRVSVWPVGLVGSVMVERPKVSSEGKVVGWDVGWRGQRLFALDMAGFAVNLKLLLQSPKAKFAYGVQRGHQESEFLKHLVQDIDLLEPKADNCRNVLVWHTRTEKVDLRGEEKRKQKGLLPTNNDIEV